MPIIGSIGAGSGRGFGLTAGGAGPIALQYLVIAGGGGGGSRGGSSAGIGGGGGGAGGYRNSFSTENSGASNCTESSVELVGGQVYTVTVGAGAAGSSYRGSLGCASSISGCGVCISSTGGGAGGANNQTGLTGGSGGGGGHGTGIDESGCGTANQGTKGAGGGESGGGGGAASRSNNVYGGAGLASSSSGSSVTRGGGGGAKGGFGAPAGGAGGGGQGSGDQQQSQAGTANTGGGGGGGHADNGVGSNGGKGIVILRVPTSCYSGTTSGSPSVSTCGACTVMVFNDSGSYTA